MNEMIEQVARAAFEAVAAALRDGHLSESDLVFNGYEGQEVGWGKVALSALAATPLREIADYLRDIPAVRRAEATDLVGGYRNRLIAEADELDAWVAQIDAALSTNTREG